MSPKTMKCVGIFAPLIPYHEVSGCFVISLKYWSLFCFWWLHSCLKRNKRSVHLWRLSCCIKCLSIKSFCSFCSNLKGKTKVMWGSWLTYEYLRFSCKTNDLNKQKQIVCSCTSSPRDALTLWCSQTGPLRPCGCGRLHPWTDRGRWSSAEPASTKATLLHRCSAPNGTGWNQLERERREEYMTE